MKHISLLLICFLFVNGIFSQNNPQPPVAERIAHEINGANGETRTDYYYWMKDRNDKKVIDYLKAENAYLNSSMNHTAALQSKLFNELKGRVKEDENSVPYKKGNYYYYTRYVEGGEYAVYCRKKSSLDAPEEIIADGNELGKNESYFNFYIEMSPDQTKACVIMDVKGRNFYTIKIKDLSTNTWLKDELKDTRNGCEWSTDGNTIIYAVPDKETLRVYQIKSHIIGTKQEDDKLLLQEDDETLDLYLYKSRSEKFLFIDCERTDANKTYMTPAANPGEMKLIQPLEQDMLYSPDHTEGDQLLITTNDHAKNYRLVAAPMQAPGKENWKDILPNRSDVFLVNVQFFKDFMVAEESMNGLTELNIMKNDGKVLKIKFDEPAYYATLGNNPEYNSTSVRYEYSSLITPYSTYDYHLETGSSQLMKQEEIPSGYDKSLYATERIMINARDGKKIPMTIVFRKDKYQKNGTAPGFIYGYGSYGYSNEDYFDSNILSLLDRGFIYANTHIRGGQEMGGEWYEDGKMMHKKNTFYDFIDCSEYLIQNNFVAKDKLFANGGSAGGLLMGAIANFRPDLYNGIIADVPFVDVMTTMEDESIPLTTFEWMEWGNPKIKEQYDYMLSYSPYDNVEKKAYPNMLVTTGLNDSQVQYFEPAKWVAKLRYMKTDHNKLYLKINMDAGHGGNSGRFESLKEIALMYAFMLDCLGEGSLGNE